VLLLLLRLPLPMLVLTEAVAILMEASTVVLCMPSPCFSPTSPSRVPWVALIRPFECFLIPVPAMPLENAGLPDSTVPSACLGDPDFLWCAASLCASLDPRLVDALCVFPLRPLLLVLPPPLLLLPVLLPLS